MIPLTKEEKKPYKEQETSYMQRKFCKDKYDENYTNRKKVKDHYHYKENSEELLIANVT